MILRKKKHHPLKTKKLNNQNATTNSTSNSRSLNQYVLVLLAKDTFADQFLSDGYRLLVRDAEIGEIVQEPRLPVVHVLSYQADERLDLRSGDVLLQELSIVVQQRRYRVLGEDIVAYLLLHEREMLGDVFLIFSVVLLR